MGELDDVIGEFLVESHENLDRFDEDLLRLERAPEDAAALDRVFRTVHTIKGTCGFFEFDALGDLAHAAEDVLDRVRRGELDFGRALADALLETGDALRAMLGAIAATGTEGDETYDQLIARLRGVAGTTAGSETAVATGRAEDTRLGNLLIERGAVGENDVGLALHSQELGDDRPLGEILADRGVVDEAEIEAALARQAALRTAPMDRSIRVDLGLLDDMMELVSELVLTRNRISQLVSQDPDTVFASAAQRLDAITTDLQQRTVKARMQPISTITNKLPRLVREVAGSCGKRARLVVDGQATELDRTVLEAIRDPLVHLVRNAIDHGLEGPEERRSAGKPAEGLLTLRAHHQAGEVLIEVTDDGAGIDTRRLVARAVERGLLPSGRASAVDRPAALELLFSPGFSTAEQVTEVSGRGVGLDVVRTNVESIGGTVDVRSELGGGTTFTVRVPLTLAIVPALIVLSGGERYALPQLSLLELLRLEPDHARASIEWVEDVAVYRHRDRLIPLVRLGTELGVDVTDERAASAITVVVLHADGQDFGLIVDEVTDTEEIVVKALGSHLDDLSLFTGAAIMGDGRVALILDVVGLAQRAGVLAGARETADPTVDGRAAAQTESTAVVIVRVGEAHRVAVASSDVARLEVVDRDRVEWSENRPVVQRRGEILPIVELGDLLGTGVCADRGAGPMQVVVHATPAGHVGFVVEEIVDIAEHVPTGAVRTEGVTAVIEGRVTDVVDLARLTEAAGLAPVSEAAGLTPAVAVEVAP